MLWSISKKGRAQTPPILQRFHKIHLCDEFWQEFNRERVQLEFNQLVEKGYFETTDNSGNDNFKFSEKGYSESEDYFKYRYFWVTSKKVGREFWVFIWKHFIVTVITAAITAYFIAKYKQKFPDISFLFFWE